MDSLHAFVVNWLWPILLLVVGMGLVVFVHEFGHFAVAKMVGIKVERFAFGFGPRVIGFQRGETEYCVNLLPVGGYVKMLGQEDVRPEDQAVSDPRAYNNKSVGARFAVISAGVVMNVVLAAVLFVIVGMVGMNVPAPVVGSVMPGMPAAMAKITWLDGCSSCPAGGAASTVPASAEAGASKSPRGPRPASSDREQQVARPASAGDVGLRPGDRITDVQGPELVLKVLPSTVEGFSKLKLVGMLADKGDRFKFTFKREVDGRSRKGIAEIPVTQVRTDTGPGFLGFGLSAAHDTVVADLSKEILGDSPFRPGDRITALDSRKVEHSWDFNAFEDTSDGNCHTFTVLRDGKDVTIPVCPTLVFRSDLFVYYLKDGTRIESNMPAQSQDGNWTVTEPGGSKRTFDDSELTGGSPNLLDLLGMSPRVEVAWLPRGERAEKEGLRSRDVIVSFAGQDSPSSLEIDAISRRFADTGADLMVQRDGNIVGPLRVKPSGAEAHIAFFRAINPRATVSAVRTGSPAARAGVQPGDTIDKINDTPVTTWSDIYQALKGLSGQEVRITYRRGGQELAGSLGLLDAKAFNPNDYRYVLTAFYILPLDDLKVKIRRSSFLGAMKWGVDETVQWIIVNYASLRQMVAGNVSPKDLSGPIGIGKAAIDMGRHSVIELVFFMAFISSALAVFNFLPFPVVDGGHAVFLLIEKIRGKPLPTKVVYYVQMAGLAAIILVFVMVTWNDINRMVHSGWH